MRYRLLEEPRLGTAGWLDADLAACRSRPLRVTVSPCPTVDVRHEHGRVEGRVVSQWVLVVSAVCDNRRREIR